MRLIRNFMLRSCRKVGIRNQWGSILGQQQVMLSMKIWIGRRMVHQHIFLVHLYVAQYHLLYRPYSDNVIFSRFLHLISFYISFVAKFTFIHTNDERICLFKALLYAVCSIWFRKCKSRVPGAGLWKLININTSNNFYRNSSKVVNTARVEWNIARESQSTLLGLMLYFLKIFSST